MIVVEAGFGSTMFTASPSWTDVSSWFRNGETVRGRPSVDQRFETGTASLTLDDRDGRFTRFNTSSPYSPNVELGVPIRVRRTVGVTTYPLFYGSARGWTPDYPTGNINATTSVTLADGFYTLNLEDLAGLSYPAQRTDERIDAVLDDIGWPAGLRDLDAGVATVQAVDFAQPGDGGEHPALAHLLDVAESEAGVLFMDASGNVVFRNRVAQASGSSAATYDGGDDYSDIQPVPDDAVLFNVFRIAREDGVQVEYDISSGAPRRVLTRDVMPMGSDAEVVNVAEWLSILFGDERQRIDGLRFKPLKSESLFEGLLGLELRDLITVQHDPPGGGTSLDAVCAVEHITHSFPVSDWTTTLSVVPLTALEQGPFFQLDVSALDGSDALA